MSMNALPSINYVYADKDGNTALIHNAQYPNRKEGWDWSKYLPGDRSDLIWQGYRPFSDVPKLINPASGLVYNSNNQVFSATDGPDNLSAADFPKSMGLQTNQTNRSLRMIEMTDGVTPVDKAALLALKYDNKYAQNSAATKIVAEVLAIDWAIDWSHDPALAKAAEHLRAWDMHTDTDSRHAALGVLTTIKDITEEFTHIPAPTPEMAFREAVDYLMQHHGRIDPTWGEVNRLVRGDIDVPIDGAPDVMRAIYPAELGEDGRLTAAAGDTWIALVEWDSKGAMSADLIHQFGSATEMPNSPHYADQAEMFATHKWRKALRNKAEIEKHAMREYTPLKP